MTLLSGSIILLIIVFMGWCSWKLGSITEKLYQQRIDAQKKQEESLNAVIKAYDTNSKRTDDELDGVFKCNILD